MDLALLDNRLAALGEPRFRSKQVWAWTARGASGYDEMTDLPAGLRSKLAGEGAFSTPTVGRGAHARDGPSKPVFRTRDGGPLEPGLMRYKDARHSLCLSSQSGCPL